MRDGMGRLLAIVLVLGSLGAFLVVYTQGPDKAFGGALARFTQKDAPKAAAYDEPAQRRGGQDWWEREERTPPPGIGQRVRERVNNAMDTGAKRHGGQ
jgi:hypothetical protein